LVEDPSAAERAAQLLKDVNLIYGVVSGVRLKFAFDWSSRKEKYDKSKSWMALGLAVGSLVFARVLATLMGGLAFEMITDLPDLEPTLVVYWLVFLLVLALLGVSAVAVVKALLHLIRVLK